MNEEFTKKQAKYFDSYSKDIIYSESFASEYEFKKLLSILDKELANKNILDLGCGVGRFGIKLAITSGANVTGIDISRKSILIANKVAQEKKVGNFKAEFSDFKNSTYENHFDFIICINMLHHTDQQELITNNIYNALKPGGSWIIFENNPINPLFFFFFLYLKQLKSHLTISYFKSNLFSLCRLIKKNKYTKVEVIRYGWLPTMLYNYSLVFLKINVILNKIYILRLFSAFHIIKCTK